jgi:hypothetical protein
MERYGVSLSYVALKTATLYEEDVIAKNTWMDDTH